jgi:hypothetical protein
MVIRQLGRLPMIDNDAMIHQCRRSQRIDAAATTVIRHLRQVPTRIEGKAMILLSLQAKETDIQGKLRQLLQVTGTAETTMIDPSHPAKETDVHAMTSRSRQVPRIDDEKGQAYKASLHELSRLPGTVEAAILHSSLQDKGTGE